MMTHLFIKYRMVTEATFHERHSINKIKIANAVNGNVANCNLSCFYGALCGLRSVYLQINTSTITNAEHTHTHTHYAYLCVLLTNGIFLLNFN